MPRKRKDVVVIDRAHLENLLVASHQDGWEVGFAQGREIRDRETSAIQQRDRSARDNAERAAGFLLKAQQRKPAQPKTPSAA